MDSMALRWRMLITQNRCLRVSIKNRERKSWNTKTYQTRSSWQIGSRAENWWQIAFNLVSVPQLSGLSLDGDLKNFSPRRRRKKREKESEYVFFSYLSVFYQCQHFCCDLIDSCKWMCWTLKRAREAWTCSTLEKSIFLFVQVFFDVKVVVPATSAKPPASQDLRKKTCVNVKIKSNEMQKLIFLTLKKHQRVFCCSQNWIYAIASIVLVSRVFALLCVYVRRYNV